MGKRRYVTSYPRYILDVALRSRDPDVQEDVKDIVSQLTTKRVGGGIAIDGSRGVDVEFKSKRAATETAKKVRRALKSRRIGHSIELTRWESSYRESAHYDFKRGQWVEEEHVGGGEYGSRTY